MIKNKQLAIICRNFVAAFAVLFAFAVFLDHAQHFWQMHLQLCFLHLQFLFCISIFLCLRFSLAFEACLWVAAVFFAFAVSFLPFHFFVFAFFFGI